MKFLLLDKHFSLTSDVAESHCAESDYHKIDAFSSMADKVKAERSIDKLVGFLSHIIGTLAQFPSWGRDCQIETFDLSGTFAHFQTSFFTFGIVAIFLKFYFSFSGLPISSTTVRILAVLSRLPIPEDWPQLTSKMLFVNP